MATITGSTSSGYWTFKLEVVENSTSIENNTSSVTVAAYIGRGSTAGGSYMHGAKISCPVNITGCAQQTISYSNTSRVNIAQGAWLHIGSVTFASVPHNDDGSKTVAVSASFSNNISPSNGSASGNVTLTTIPRKSTMTIANGTLGTAQTITVSRKSTAFTHTIAYSCGNYNGYVCQGSTASSISWTPPMDFAYGAPNGTSVYISLTLYTYNGGSLVGSNSYSIQGAIPASVKPSVSFTIGDGKGYLSTYGAYIQGKSTFTINVSASGSYGSSIKSYKTTADNKQYTTTSITTSVISGSGTLTITATVTDSRGRTATSSKTVTVLPYSIPRITSISIKRTDSNGASSPTGGYLTVTFSSSMAALNNKNGSGYAIQYKKLKESDSTYTYVDLTQYANNLNVTNGTYTFPADTSSSYDVILAIADNFDRTTATIVGSPVAKLLSILKRGFGLAVGKTAELEDTFEIGFDTICYNKLHVKSPSGNLNDVGNFIDYGFITAYVYGATTLNAGSTIPFVLGRQLGDFFTVNSSGEVVVGANVKTVRITACVGGSSTAGRVWGQLRVNGKPILGGDAIAYGAFCTATVTSVCVVNEGDRIGIVASDAFSAADGGVGCYMNIERIK